MAPLVLRLRVQTRVLGVVLRGVVLRWRSVPSIAIAAHIGRIRRRATRRRVDSVRAPILVRAIICGAILRSSAAHGLKVHIPAAEAVILLAAPAPLSAFLRAELVAVVGADASGQQAEDVHHAHDDVSRVGSVGGGAEDAHALVVAALDGLLRLVVLAGAVGVVEEDREEDLFKCDEEVRDAVGDVLPRDIVGAVDGVLAG